MEELKFINKNISTYCNSSAYSNIYFQKPQTCPHCSINTDATYIQLYNHNIESNKPDNLLMFVWRCTVCKKLFISFHTLHNKECSFVGLFPKNESAFADEHIAKISPKFINMYNQALRAESNNDFDLAAVGFRSALEILIKDYAIVCLNIPKENVINLKLIRAISEFLDEVDLEKTADVIRILGNDHTHYERKYPEYDFMLLKNYMDIFISLIRTKILIKSPPVTR